MEHKPWLSLPDEDPPERGLAELMAAARAKAEVMAHPPWWKRLADLMKRPPVLALATVIVLIGGVIVVHREPAEMAAPPTATESMPAASPPPTESMPAGAPAAAQSAPAAPGGFGIAQPPPPAIEHDADRPARLEKAPIAGKYETAPIARKNETAPIAGKTEKAAEVNADSKLAPADTRHVETGSVEVDLVSKGQADDASVVGGVAKDPQTRTPNDAVKQTANVKQTVRRGETTKKPPPADSLARCRAAATNKDCAGARACAKQIESESPEFYKANVANDATLKPCL